MHWPPKLKRRLVTHELIQYVATTCGFQPREGILACLSNQDSIPSRVLQGLRHHTPFPASRSRYTASQWVPNPNVLLCPMQRASYCACLPGWSLALCHVLRLRTSYMWSSKPARASCHVVSALSAGSRATLCCPPRSGDVSLYDPSRPPQANSGLYDLNPH